MAEAAPQAPAHDPFDAGFTRDMIEQVFDAQLRHYFRPRLIGGSRMPAKGPLILAANHSGTAFPYDAMVLDALLWRRDGLRPEAKFRPVFEKELALHWWMRPFGMDDFWRRAGGVDMTFDNFDRLLARGDRVAYYPEGVPGIGKGFDKRYRLQRFSSSFVTLAAKHDAPVVPVYIVNAEWVIPFNFTLRPIDWLMQRCFGVPFLPLPAAPLGMAFPWCWYLALPARMTMVVGEPFDVRALIRETCGGTPEQADRETMRRVAEQIRQGMQRGLDRHVARFGGRPYHWRHLWRALGRARARRRLARTLPTGWAASFVRFERDRRREPARGRLHAIARDWDLVGYYVPFGWPLISLSRALRRAPHGYRGLSPDGRRVREGGYVWHLRDRPLPPR